MRTPISSLITVGLSAILLSGASCLRDSARQNETPRCVVFVLDVSQSVPVDIRSSMMEYINRTITTHRRPMDQVGVIVFGREAHWEIPIGVEDPLLPTSIESPVDSDATDLAAAIRLAATSYPPGYEKRLVIISDGNQTRSDALCEAKSAAAAGITTDIVPIRYHHGRDVAVERLAIPHEVVGGRPVEACVTISNFAETTEDDGIVSGRLQLTARVGEYDHLLNANEQLIELKPGKNLFSFEHKISAVGICRYQAVFAPDDPADDVIPHNNRAEAFAQISGKGGVLFIEDGEHQGEFDFLVQLLRDRNIDVTLMTTDEAFTDFAELVGYDSVMLANVPRSSGQNAGNVIGFSDERIRILVRNTRSFGCGLTMLGGTRSFGAGGWSNTEMEEAMPVDFHIENSALGPGALVIIADSVTPEGNHRQRIFAREAMNPLGASNYFGLICRSQGGHDQWLWGGEHGLMRLGNERNKILARMSRMMPGYMPALDPPMKMALASLNQCDAPVKHVIIASDRAPAAPDRATIHQFRQAKITVSTVDLGNWQGDERTLQDIADATGGKFYGVRDNRALGRIAQHEARRACRSLVYDGPQKIQPRVNSQHEILRGIQGPFPLLRGFAMTTAKDNPLVEVSLAAPIPGDDQDATILATWKFGTGRAVAFTADAGERWAGEWKQWKHYDRFFSQMIVWAMRPSTEPESGVIGTDVRDGVLYITVDDLNPRDGAQPIATVALPTHGVVSVRLERTAVNRFSGRCEANEGGLYVVSLGNRRSMIRAETVPSPEFRDRKTNDELLEAIAALKPAGGPAGKIIERGTDDSAAMVEVNPFRDIGLDN